MDSQNEATLSPSPTRAQLTSEAAATEVIETAAESEPTSLSIVLPTEPNSAASLHRVDIDQQLEEMYRLRASIDHRFEVFSATDNGSAHSMDPTPEPEDLGIFPPEAEFDLLQHGFRLRASRIQEEFGDQRNERRIQGRDRGRESERGTIANPRPRRIRDLNTSDREHSNAVSYDILPVSTNRDQPGGIPTGIWDFQSPPTAEQPHLQSAQQDPTFATTATAGSPLSTEDATTIADVGQTETQPDVLYPHNNERALAEVLAGLELAEQRIDRLLEQTSAREAHTNVESQFSLFEYDASARQARADTEGHSPSSGYASQHDEMFRMYTQFQERHRLSFTLDADTDIFLIMPNSRRRPMDSWRDSSLRTMALLNAEQILASRREPTAHTVGIGGGLRTYRLEDQVNSNNSPTLDNNPNIPSDSEPVDSEANNIFSQAAFGLTAGHEQARTFVRYVELYTAELTAAQARMASSPQGISPRKLRESEIAEVVQDFDGTVDEETVCQICLGSFCSGDCENPSTITHELCKCRVNSRVYGKECIKIWLRDKTTCPVCRKIILHTSSALRGRSPSEVFHSYWERYFTASGIAAGAPASSRVSDVTAPVQSHGVSLHQMAVEVTFISGTLGPAGVRIRWISDAFPEGRVQYTLAIDVSTILSATPDAGETIRHEATDSDVVTTGPPRSANEILSITSFGSPDVSVNISEEHAFFQPAVTQCVIDAVLQRQRDLALQAIGTPNVGEAARPYDANVLEATSLAFLAAIVQLPAALPSAYTEAMIELNAAMTQARNQSDAIIANRPAPFASSNPSTPEVGSGVAALHISPEQLTQGSTASEHNISIDTTTAVENDNALLRDSNAAEEIEAIVQVPEVVTPAIVPAASDVSVATQDPNTMYLQRRRQPAQTLHESNQIPEMRNILTLVSVMMFIGGLQAANHSPGTDVDRPNDSADYGLTLDRLENQLEEMHHETSSRQRRIQRIIDTLERARRQQGYEERIADDLALARSMLGGADAQARETTVAVELSRSSLSFQAFRRQMNRVKDAVMRVPLLTGLTSYPETSVPEEPNPVIEERATEEFNAPTDDIVDPNRNSAQRIQEASQHIHVLSTARGREREMLDWRLAFAGRILDGELERQDNVFGNMLESARQEMEYHQAVITRLQARELEIQRQVRSHDIPRLGLVTETIREIYRSAHLDNGRAPEGEDIW